MDFMGIGPFELLLILIIAFLFFGPEKLPEIAAKTGQLYRNFKKASSGLTKTITEEFQGESKVEKTEDSKSAPAPTPDEKINER